MSEGERERRKVREKEKVGFSVMSEIFNERFISRTRTKDQSNKKEKGGKTWKMYCYKERKRVRKFLWFNL